MKQFACVLFLIFLAIAETGFSQDEFTIAPPFSYDGKVSVPSEVSTKLKILGARRRVDVDGQYEGTLNLTRIRQRGVPGCNGSDSFYYSFVVSTYKRYASVYLQNGTELTGRRKKKSFRTILDTGSYTYRVRGKRCRGTACFFSLSITEWSSGSNYCKGTWKGWMYADK